MADERDISGRDIPARETRGLARTLAIPPVREAPNEYSTELLWSGFSNLAAGGAAFVQLTDPSTSAAFAQQMNPRNIARLSSMMIYCPDMVSDVAPYLFVQMQVAGQNAGAWNFVPIYPRAGVASLTFPMSFDIPAGATVKLFGKNTDAVNAHVLSVYLYGWYWPKSIIQG